MVDNHSFCNCVLTDTASNTGACFSIGVFSRKETGKTSVSPKDPSLLDNNNKKTDGAGGGGLFLLNSCWGRAGAHFFLIAPALAGSSEAPFGSFVLFPMYKFQPFYLEGTLRRIEYLSRSRRGRNLVSGKERKRNGGATRVDHRQTSGKVLASI